MLIRFLYTLGIKLYGLVIRLAAPFVPKARKWVHGRKNWKKDWKSLQQAKGEIIWFHCASLGEFEQGRPLMEQIKTEFPSSFLLVSFFSPSGYEVIKEHNLPDRVLYLPLDTPKHAHFMLQQVRPKLVVLVKYEFWLNWLKELFHQDIPVLLIAARVDASSAYLRGMLRGLYKKTFEGFTHIFTQDSASKEVLLEFAPQAGVKVSADTRFDRVLANRQQHVPIPEIDHFIQNRVCWVIGSSYIKDEEAALHVFEKLSGEFNLCLIFAPHEIDASRIQNWMEKYPHSLAYSSWDKSSSGDILWIDHIGMLSSLYFYADLAGIGGGWNHGLHNILEAATFGCPIFFGPEYQNFPEAVDLLKEGGAFSYKNKENLYELVKNLLGDLQLKTKIGRINKSYVDARAGASGEIYQFLIQERLIL